jgi:hypothetical protein
MMKHFILLGISASFIFVIQCAPASTSSNDSDITYLDSGLYGVNILNQKTVQFFGNEFSLCVKIPENKSVVVKLFRMQNSGWFVGQSTISNWSVSDYNWSEKSQTLTSVSGNMTSDLKLEMESDQYRIEYYENQESELTFSKGIEI